MKKQTLLWLSLITLVAVMASPVYAATIPVTGDFYNLPQISSIYNFFEQIALNGNAKQPAAIYLANTLASPIVQQPSDNPGFVSTQPDVVTQFGMARNYGTIALLAHNYLAGMNFHSLVKGQEISLVYGDQHVETYRITDIKSYQALSPLSPYSKFIDLADPEAKEITSTDLFYTIYDQPGMLVLQTCIEKDGESSWGRLFIIAAPVESVPQD